MLCSSVVTAQQFTHSLSIASKQNGLQALAVSPELKNIANTSFNDVRLYDKNSNEVPYFLVNESLSYSSTNFKEYKIKDKEVGKGQYTRLTILNPNKENIRYVVLCIANSDAWKYCNITGSDDEKQWYSVSDHIFMYNLFSENSTLAYRSINFPMVNYKFIKIEINDLGTLPLNILKAGYFAGAISAGKLNEVTPEKMAFTTNKEKKLSLYTADFKYSTAIDRIQFKIKAPNYYKRRAQIFVTRTRTVKQKEEQYQEVLLEFELNSNTANIFDVSNFREKNIGIEIFNADNPPLEIESIAYSQLQTYLVADFKQGENYKLMAGNKKLSAPVYDIEFFKNKISQYLPTLEVSGLNEIAQDVPPPIVAPAKKLWEEPWFMWACISVASFVLFLFSIRVLKDMKKGN